MSFHKLRLDIIALYIAHGARYLFILATLPYLARILEPDNFGLLIFYQAMGMIIAQIVEYGFAYNGTRYISQITGETQKLNIFLSNVLFSQLLLIIFCIIPLCLLFIFILNDALLFVFIWTLLYAFLQGINLYWFLRGIEKIKLIAKLEVCSKLLSVCLLFFFVDNINDLSLVMFIFFIGNLIPFLLSLFIINKEYNFTTPNLGASLNILKDGWDSFLVRAGGSIIGDGNVLLAGILLNPPLYGIFAGSYRIINAVRGLFLPLIDGLFPYFTKKSLIHDVGGLVSEIAPLMISFGAFLSLFIYLFSDFIVHLLLGEMYFASANYLKLFSILPLLISILHTYGTQWMLVIGKEALYSKIVIFSGFFGLFLNMLLTPLLQINGAIIALLASYLVIAVTSSTLFLLRQD